MTTPLVVTFVGDDRPGLLNAIADRIAASGGTWLESRSARLAGKFAGVLLANAPDEKVAELEASLAGLAAHGLDVTVERGAADKPKPRRLVRLEIVGHERPGIVREVTRALSGLNVNIEEFSSDIEGAAFTGVEMFRAAARLAAPEGLPLDELRRALERLAGEIMVDLAVGEEEAR